MQINILDLGRRGTLAAMLPGLFGAFGGWYVYLAGTLGSLALVFISKSIRAGLSLLVWYRWYFGLHFVGTSLMAALMTFTPDLKPSIVAAWAIFSVAVTVAYLPLMLRVYRKNVDELGLVRRAPNVPGDHKQ